MCACMHMHVCVRVCTRMHYCLSAGVPVNFCTRVCLSKQAYEHGYACVLVIVQLCTCRRMCTFVCEFNVNRQIGLHASMFPETECYLLIIFCPCPDDFKVSCQTFFFPLQSCPSHTLRCAKTKPSQLCPRDQLCASSQLKGPEFYQQSTPRPLGAQHQSHQPCCCTAQQHTCCVCWPARCHQQQQQRLRRRLGKPFLP